MESLAVGRKLDSYTGVIIHAGQDGDGNAIDYSAGNATGYVLELTNPIGTREMAQAILAGLRLRGVRYQPFEAGNAILDPSAELGDNVTVNGLASLLFSKFTRHSHLMAADAAAPHDEEVDHEFSYVPPTVREFRRESAYTRSRLTINEEAITAEVVRATGAEETLSGRITVAADAITAEVTRATTAEGALSSRITQTADAITSEVTRATTAEGNLSTRIDQRLDSITLAVSSSAGSSVFTIKDGSTTLSTQQLDLSVKAVNVSGTLTANQIDATNLHVSAANVDGKLSASQISVGFGSNQYSAYDSFEQISNDTIYTSKSANLTPSVISSQFARDGQKLLQLVTTNTGSTSFIYLGNSSSWAGFPRLTPGRYVASCYVIRAGGDQSPTVGLRVLATTARNSSFLSNATIMGTTEITLSNSLTWPESQRIEVPFEVTSARPFVFLQLRNTLSSTDETAVPSSTIYVDCIQIEAVDSADQSAGAWKPATMTTIDASSITTGTLNATTVNVTNLNATNITAGTLPTDRIGAESITGGSGGKISGSTITTHNTVSGINTNLGYGAAYGAATVSGTGSYPSYFTCGYLRVTSGISMSGAVFTPKTTTIGDVTIHYLGY